MGFRQGAYATVWEITEESEKYTKVRISTSRKNKKTDEYVTDFNGFVRLVSSAHENWGLISAAIEQNERCRIKLGACDVTNRYDKEAGREYVNYTLFDFEMAEGSQDEESEKPAKKTSAKSNTKSAGAKKTTTKKTAVKKSALEADSDKDGESEDEDLPF